MTPTVLRDPGVGEPPSITRLVEQNVLSPLMAAYMWFIVERKALFFIAGPTGSGKTTLLNALLCLMGPTEALKPDLGMKSDYLIVGEIRTARDLNTFLDVMRAGALGPRDDPRLEP
jgi:type IV secretory pathway ATPase VirB11/archaellum biosynthesis ATPase